MEDILLYVGAYLLGTVPVGKLGKAKGKAVFWTRFGLDLFKGALVVTIAHAVSPHDEPDWVLAGFLGILGDRFPFHSKFKSDVSFGTTMGVFAGVIGWLLTR
jgi:glycerol-3-phosphate acyltransferase PlsY